jgi:multidrug efflux pump
MKITSLFIARPVLTIVVNITVVIFGLITAGQLGVRDYPAVDPPVISVSTSYAGANADVIENKITEPLESSINGINGIRTLTSSSSDGSSRITVEFALGTDLEAAANDVRDRVSRARRGLPDDVDNPVVTKADASTMPILFVTLQSDTRSPLELTDFAADVFVDRFQTIPDVSDVGIWGEKRRSMRLWMDPAKMAAAGITPQDVKTALDRENVELPSGRLEGGATEFTIKTSGALSTTGDFNSLILRASNGKITRFGDIGQAIEGPENERSIMKRDGVPMVGVALIPQAGANHIAIANEFYKRFTALQAQLPPDVKASIGFDTSRYIRASVTEVLETILLSFCLVVLVIFGFLRNIRATLIPVLAMPISLIGTFFIMYACGFSINILTLLGIVLATGLVVDDAIVVLENIYQKIEQGLSPNQAGHKGAAEIQFAIIATTLAIMSVMLPIIIMPGMTGRLFREFGTVVAGAVAFSAAVSLSLTPMLCSHILKHHKAHEKTLYGRTEPFFAALIEGYRKSLVFFLARRWVAFVVIGAACGMIGVFYAILPRELAPMEDRNRFSISATGPEGASYEYMQKAMDKVFDIANKTVGEQEREGMIMRIPGGGGGGGSGGVNSGVVQVILAPASDRNRSQQQIADELTRNLRRCNEVRAFVTQEQTIGGRFGGLPVQMVVAAPTLDMLKEKIPLFVQQASRDSTFQTVDVNMKFSKPQIRIDIDRERARDLGVSTIDIAQSLQLAFSGSRYGYYVSGGKQYQIIGQYYRQNRDKPLDLTSFLVRNRDGSFVPLDNMVELSESGSPPQLYRYNRMLSATVSAGLASGKTMDQGITAMKRIAASVLPIGYSTALAGAARDFAESSSNLALTFLFALLLIYLVLSAQFESFRHPFIVMFTVPLALAGALFSLWYFNQSLNIFSQIGIIMLIGLVTKNGILIVEFANQRRAAGAQLFPALIEASVSRFRPIVMTSLTVVLGSMPIALGLGASARSRVSLGIVVIGGLLFALVLSLYVIPIIYSFLGGKSRKKQE